MEKEYRFKAHVCVDGHFSQMDASFSVKANSKEEAIEKLKQGKHSFVEYDYDSIEYDSMRVERIEEVYEDTIEEG